MHEIKTINLGFVNVFLIKVKNGFILIDTGLSQEWNKLESELKSAGCLPKKLKLVILTHGDIDHSGNCKNLQEKYNVQIAMHKGDYAMIQSGIFIKRKTRTLLFKIMFFFAKALKKFQKDIAESIKFKPNFYLKDGQNLKEYGLDAEILHIPGHTKGSIAILTKDHDLFIGDTLINMNKPDYAIIIENDEELKKSLAKIKKLHVKTIYPGHGKPFQMEHFLKSIK